MRFTSVDIFSFLDNKITATLTLCVDLCIFEWVYNIYVLFSIQLLLVTDVLGEGGGGNGELRQLELGHHVQLWTCNGRLIRSYEIHL